MSCCNRPPNGGGTPDLGKLIKLSLIMFAVIFLLALMFD